MPLHIGGLFGEGSIYHELDSEQANDADNSERGTGAASTSLASDKEDNDLDQPPPVLSSDRVELKQDPTDTDNEVPKSLLTEHSRVELVEPSGSRYFAQRGDRTKRQGSQPLLPQYRRHTPVLHGAKASKNLPSINVLDPKERALWKWANVDNLDIFLQEVYGYYLGNGFYCILLSRTLNMLTFLFVVWFSTYLTSCIDYSKVRQSSTLSEIQIPRCVSNIGVLHKSVLWLFSLTWFLKAFQYLGDIRRLSELRNFYTYLLEIPESDMQTISWQTVVQRLMLLRDQNLTTSKASRSTKRLDPHSIANRIMRKDNYMIALVNKNVLNLDIPFPFLRGKTFFTRTMEWNISLCIMNYVFNEEGQLRPIFLKESHRRVLSEGLKRRFIFVGVMNIILAPFIIVYFCLLYFFRYFNEYRRDPSTIGTRQYTPIAEWKIRELNELYHLFQRRLNMSYLPASRYVDQFPREKSAILMKFIGFVAGSFAAVLGVASLIDPELFLGFEITKDRTVLFYIGVFSSILAISRGMIPEETLVFDPEASMRYVAEFTHYLPKEWEGRLHSHEVKEEFSKMYDMKIIILLKELASFIVAPFILWYSLPQCSDRVIDFFREFTLHVDGLGYVCSFAVFNFDKARKTSQFTKHGYYGTEDGKMLKSYLNFVDNYGERNTRTALPAHNTPHVPHYNDQMPVGDLESSVMGKFKKIYSPDVHDRPGSSIHGSTENQRIFTRVPPPEEDYLDAGIAESDTIMDPDLSFPNNTGVIGLLNQLYKQANTDTPKRT